MSFVFLSGNPRSGDFVASVWYVNRVLFYDYPQLEQVKGIFIFWKLSEIEHNVFNEMKNYWILYQITFEKLYRFIKEKVFNILNYKNCNTVCKDEVLIWGNPLLNTMVKLFFRLFSNMLNNIQAMRLCTNVWLSKRLLLSMKKMYNREN